MSIISARSASEHVRSGSDSTFEDGVQPCAGPSFERSSNGSRTLRFFLPAAPAPLSAFAALRFAVICPAKPRGPHW